MSHYKTIGIARPAIQAATTISFEPKVNAEAALVAEDEAAEPDEVDEAIVEDEFIIVDEGIEVVKAEEDMTVEDEAGMDEPGVALVAIGGTGVFTLESIGREVEPPAPVLWVNVSGRVSGVKK